MKRFDAPRLLPDWLSGGLHAAAVGAASLVLVACWLAGEPAGVQAQEPMPAPAEAMRHITLPTVVITARSARPDTATTVAANRTDCAPSGAGVNLQQ